MNYEIKDLNQQMEGITYLDNKITFVKNTLPKEIIFLKNIKNFNKYNIAECDKIIKKSPLRVKEQCPYFKECGGCFLQHVKYDESINLKYNNFVNLLKINKIKFTDIKIYKNDNPYYYRNKIELKITENKIGYYKNRSHEIIDISKCIITKKSINNCIEKIKLLNIKNGNVIIRCNYNEEIIIIINTLDKIKIDFNYFKKDVKLVGIILNDKLIYGQDFFYEILNNLIFKVSYKSFFQVNKFTNEIMQKIIIDNISQNEKVLDLYCGVGTFTLNASLKAKIVYGIELSFSSIENAIKNKKINKINNVEFFQGNTTDIVNKLNENFDTLIIDPPRNGLTKKMRNYILNNNFAKIIYVSCNPITLVRDLKDLNKKYVIEELNFIDSFSYTYHIETITILKKLNCK